MRKSRTLALLVFLVACAGCGSPAVERSAPGPHEFLPEGTFDVDVLEVVAPPPAEELAARLQAAIDKNLEWYRQHVRANPTAEFPPYDVRLGVTREEYEQFLALRKQAKLQRVRGAKLVVTRMEGGIYVIYGGKDLPELSGIALDLGRDEVRTPLGVAPRGSDVGGSADQAQGEWKGVQWLLESYGADGKTPTRVRFALGRRADSGRGMLFYDVEQLVDGRTTRRTLALNYDLPAKS